MKKYIFTNVNDLSRNIASGFKEFEKAHVKGHTRTTKSGKQVQVKDHDDKRQKHQVEIHSVSSSSSKPDHVTLNGKEYHVNDLHKNTINKLKKYADKDSYHSSNVREALRKNGHYAEKKKDTSKTPPDHTSGKYREHYG